jgi:hypothetical protein
VRPLVLLGLATVALTETLSLFDAISAPWLIAAWCVIVGAGVWWDVWYGVPVRLGRPDWFEGSATVAVAAVLGVIAWTALLSPPNSADAMAYHLPRVVYWAQAGSVRFFPTPYLNQIMLQPLAEYMMLQTYVLTGGDHFVNLVAWLGFAGSVVGVSAIAREAGLSGRAQAFAAVFCVTLPNGILQASGAKNDCLLALWIVCAVYFTLKRCTVWAGLSVGLALATKATAYLFVPFILAGVLLAFPIARQRRRLATACLLAVAVNIPQFWRNIDLSGSPLGFDSAQGDGVFRWRNEPLGWKPAVSNVLRNLSDQLGSRSLDRNAAIYNAVVQVHSWLGVDPQGPGSTWPGEKFGPPVNSNHEANANNRWHLLLAFAALLFALVKRSPWAWYAAGLATAFVAFCTYLKWQPYLARLELPLFILSAPLAAFLFEALRFRIPQVLLCVALLANARAPLFQNWTRPLKTLMSTPREQNYFNDMVQWNNKDTYLNTVALVSKSTCETIGIDITHNQLEYPLQALLPGKYFVHTGVENVSKKYARNEPDPCTVICLDCAGDEKKRAQYAGFGEPRELGRFWLFGPGL